MEELINFRIYYRGGGLFHENFLDKQHHYLQNPVWLLCVFDSNASVVDERYRSPILI